MRPAEELRRYLRVRLADGRLFAARGMDTVRKGTGRPCNICERAISATTMEHQVLGPGIIGFAHEECYTIWARSPLTSKVQSPKGQPQEGGSSPSGELPGAAVTPGAW